MTSLVAPEVMSSCGRDQELARRRLQQKGDLFDQGGMWKLRWHEDKVGPDGELGRGVGGGAHRPIGWTRQAHRKGSSAPGLGELPVKARRRRLHAELGDDRRKFR